jgi:hypothetical protein
VVEFLSQSAKLDRSRRGYGELTNDLEDTVDGADVGQEVVSETGTGRGALGETGNVDTGEECGDFRLGLVELDQPVESLCGARTGRGSAGFGMSLCRRKFRGLTIRNRDTGLFRLDGSAKRRRQKGQPACWTEGFLF